jgi:hypothetical protein
MGRILLAVACTTLQDLKPVVGATNGASVLCWQRSLPLCHGLGRHDLRCAARRRRRSTTPCQIQRASAGLYIGGLRPGRIDGKRQVSAGVSARLLRRSATVLQGRVDSYGGQLLPDALTVTFGSTICIAILMNAVAEQQPQRPPQPRQRGRGTRDGQVTAKRKVEWGLPHRGRISPEEAAYVREHLDEVQKLRSTRGMPLIDPADPRTKERYGL